MIQTELDACSPPPTRTPQGRASAGDTDDTDTSEHSVAAVPWLPGAFLRLPASAALAHLELYRNASIYGMDAASGAAVAALAVRQGEHCLDLCCAPGAKLALLADLAATTAPVDAGDVSSGSVTGVDLSRERLGACRTLARKYALPATRLFCADGTTFSQPPPETEGGRVVLRRHDLPPADEGEEEQEEEAEEASEKVDEVTAGRKRSGAAKTTKSARKRQRRAARAADASPFYTSIPWESWAAAQERRRLQPQEPVASPERGDRLYDKVCD